MPSALCEILRFGRWQLLSLVATFIGTILLPPPLSAEPTPNALPKLGADISQTTVSGLSSGAYMAGQFHIVHSNHVTGAAILAGGPFGCAESWQARTFSLWPGIESFNAAQAISGCMKNKYRTFGIPSAKGLFKRAQRLERKEQIDPLSNLKDDKAYLFSGDNDEVVHTNIVSAANDFYALAGIKDNNLKFEKHDKAGHTFATENAGNKNCAASKKPYIADCDYDQAGAILNFIAGPLKQKGNAQEGKFLTFNQHDFAPSGFHSLAKKGYLFVPNDCAQTSECKIHIVFHGCEQSAEEIDDLLVRRSGFAEWASTNKIILLFPQIKKDKFRNPFGCWDWWGYTSANFTTKSAPQIEAVWDMLNHLSKKP